jgi:hypothetical protein
MSYDRAGVYRPAWNRRRGPWEAWLDCQPPKATNRTDVRILRYSCFIINCQLRWRRRCYALATPAFRDCDEGRFHTRDCEGA